LTRNRDFEAHTGSEGFKVSQTVTMTVSLSRPCGDGALWEIWAAGRVAGPGRTPMPGNNSGLSHPGSRASGKAAWAAMDSRRGTTGGPGRPPFWRTPVSPVRDLARDIK